MAETLRADLQDNAASTTLVASTGTSGALTNAGNTSASTTTGPTASLTRAILFDGSNDYGAFTTGNQSVVRNTGYGFVSCWAKCDAISATGVMVFVSANASTTNNRITLALSSTGQLVCLTKDGDFGTNITKTSAGRYLGKWHHFAALIDVANDTVTLYVDGQAVSSTGSTSFTASVFDNTTSNVVNIGSANAGASPFPGAIAGVRIYNSNEGSNLATIIGESTPTCTNSDVSVVEGRSLWLTLTSNSVALPTWVLGGADAALLTVDRDGRVQPKSLKYFASPADANTDNVYAITATPTNAAGAGSAQAINITVTAGNRTGMMRPQDATSATYTYHFDNMNAATFGGSFPNENDAITTWTDASGVGGVNLTQSTAAIYYKPGEANGGGALQLGTGGAMLSGVLLTGANWTEYTVIVVAKPLNDTAVAFVAHTTPATSFMTVGRSGGYANFDGSGFSGAVQSRDSGYAIFSNTRNATDASTGVPPGAGVRWINGSCYGSANGASSGSQTAGGSFRIGNVFSVTQPNILEVIIYRGALSHIETAKIHQHLIDKWGIATKERFAIVFLGNSMTTGESQQYPSTAMRELFDDNARNVELYNLAQTGGSSATLGRQATMIADVRTWLESRGVKAVLVMNHGHNDGGWVSAVQTDLLTYSSAWQGGGHKSIGVTLTPSVIAGTPNTTAFNASESWFVSNAASFSGVAHVNELTWCDETADVTNNPLGYWAADGLHFTATGQVAFGEWMAPKILTLLEGLEVTGRRRRLLIGMGN